MRITRREMLLVLASLYGTSLFNRSLLPSFASPVESGARNGLVPLIFDRHYNMTLFGLERLHPFDGRKFGKIHRSLIGSGIRTQHDFTSPIALTEEMLLQVHTEEYLQSLRHSRALAKIFNVPTFSKVPAGLLNSRILAPMRLAGGGTLLTCRSALKHVQAGFDHP